LQVNLFFGVDHFFLKKTLKNICIIFIMHYVCASKQFLNQKNNVMKKIIRDLLSLDCLPCSEAAEWAGSQKFEDKADMVISAIENWRQWVAIHTADQEILSVLASDQHWAVRSSVAQNANTPVDTLTAMASDKDSDVRRSAINNKNYKI